mgnify:CR=1 FL=1
MVDDTRPQPAPRGASIDEWNDLQREKFKEKEDLAKLSRNARFVVDPSSGHDVHVDNPQLVAQAIQQVIEAAGTRATNRCQALNTS